MRQLAALVEPAVGAEEAPEALAVALLAFLILRASAAACVAFFTTTITGAGSPTAEPSVTFQLLTPTSLFKSIVKNFLLDSGSKEIKLTKFERQGRQMWHWEQSSNQRWEQSS